MKGLHVMDRSNQSPLSSENLFFSETEQAPQSSPRHHNNKQNGGTACCLGPQPHVVLAEEVICHLCGSLIAGAQLGIYQVQRLLGRGRNGLTYLATHLRSQQAVSLKCFSPYSSGFPLWESARREVRQATALRHPAIAPVFSCTIWHPQQPSAFPLQGVLNASISKEGYLLALGQYYPNTLEQFLQQYQRVAENLNPVLFQQLIQIIHRLGNALQTAHQHGLVHGAITFGNILLDQQGEAVLADFGLARLHPLAPPYLAPELQQLYQQAVQTRNQSLLWQSLNPSTDIYAMAILCHQLFSRTLPANLQEHIYPVLQCATAQNPGRRFPTVEQFVQELIHRLTDQRHSTSGIQRSSNGSWPTTPPITKPDLYAHTSSSGAHTSGIRAQQPTPILNNNEDWEKRGDRFFTEHDYNNAIKAYKRALEATPQKASLWLALGDALFALNHLDDALHTYEQAIQQNPNDPLAWTNRGTALDALGRHGEALDCFERADQLR